MMSACFFHDSINCWNKSSHLKYILFWDPSNLFPGLDFPTLPCASSPEWIRLQPSLSLLHKSARWLCTSLLPFDTVLQISGHPWSVPRFSARCLPQLFSLVPVALLVRCWGPSAFPLSRPGHPRHNLYMKKADYSMIKSSTGAYALFFAEIFLAMWFCSEIFLAMCFVNVIAT